MPCCPGMENDLGDREEAGQFSYGSGVIHVNMGRNDIGEVSHPELLHRPLNRGDGRAGPRLYQDPFSIADEVNGKDAFDPRKKDLDAKRLISHFLDLCHILSVSILSRPAEG